MDFIIHSEEFLVVIHGVKKDMTLFHNYINIFEKK
jgi:hypothetical protein